MDAHCLNQWTVNTHRGVELHRRKTYSEIAIASQPVSNLVDQFLCILPYRGDGLVLELGRHFC